VSEPKSEAQIKSTAVTHSIKGPILLSVLLHVGVVGVLFASTLIKFEYEQPSVTVDLSNSEFDEVAPTAAEHPPDTEEIVEAVTVDSAQVQQQVERIQRERREREAAEQRRVQELERRAAAARQQREAEQRQQQELAAQRQRERQEAEAEKQRLAAERAEAEAAAQAAAERREREEAAAREAEAERERLAEQRRQEEAERQRQAEQERQRAERAAQLQRELEQEMAKRQQARRQQMLSEIEKYTALIQQTIQRNWNIDDSMRGKSCELTINLASSGFVTSVDTGSGDANVCRSARNAVLKANTLPVSEDPEVYAEMRTIKLTVRPEL